MKTKPPAQREMRSRPPLERMMRIHQVLLDGKYPNASKLSRQIEVCTKTIHRDLEFMRDRLGLPIEYDPQRFGYYYTEEVASFPSLQITEGELFALLVAEKALQQYRGTPFEKPLLSALRKMAESLPDTVSLNLAEWERIISFRTSAEPILQLDVIDALARATAGHRQLALEYRKPGRKEFETRIVDPYHLANINGEWFLFGFCHWRKDIRTFVPARMQSLRETGEVFRRPKDFSIEKRLRDSFGVITGQGDFQVVIRFTDAVADYVREKRWHPSQQLRELPEGGLELRLRLSSLAEIQRWILSWGGQAVVVAPPDLAAAVRRAAQLTLSAHEQAEDRDHGGAK